MQKRQGRARRRPPLEIRKTYLKRRGLLVLIAAVFGYLLYLATFSQAVVVEGNITDADSGKPLSRATVKLEGRSVSTNKEGEYRFEHVKLGKQVLSVKLKGYEEQIKRINVRRGVNHFDFALRRGVVLGVVKARDIGKVIKGALVSIDGRKDTTDRDGKFRLKQVSVGRQKVKVYYKKRVVLEQEIDVDGGNNRIDLVIESILSALAAKPVKPGTSESKIFTPISPQVIKRGNPKLKKVAITIDDGWRRDDRILSLMEQYGIRCTVFIIGGRGIGERNPEWIARMDRQGFEICTHTYSHFIVTGLSDEQLTEDLRKGQMVLTNITHKMYPYMRPSGGIYDQRTLKVIAKNGYKVVLWSNVLTDTVKRRTTSERVQHVLNNLKNGDIILCHFGGYNTYDALKAIIPEILRRGYQIVTVSEVLEGM